MIVFVGDRVRLHNDLLYTDLNVWHQIVDIKPYDICELSNGDLVCASSDYIAEVQAADSAEMAVVIEQF